MYPVECNGYSFRKIVNGLATFCIVASFFFPSVVQAHDHDRLAQLISQRLSYMKDVAKYKVENNLPVEDLAQEGRVIEKSVAEAESLSLNGESIKPFMKAQMNAAKAIQYRYHADWLSAPEKALQPRNLDTIRAEISSLNTELIKQLAKDLKEDKRMKCSFMDMIQLRNLKSTDKDIMCSALKQVKLK